MFAKTVHILFILNKKITANLIDNHNGVEYRHIYFMSSKPVLVVCQFLISSFDFQSQTFWTLDCSSVRNGAVAFDLSDL
jgi:hypothetical protein